MNAIVILVVALVSIGAAASSHAVEVQIANQTHQGPDWSQWQFGKDWQLTVHHTCGHTHVLGFWPTDPSCEGQAKFDRLSMDGAYGVYESKLNGIELTLDGHKATSLQVHKSLADGRGSNVLGLNGVEFKLENFEAITKADRASVYAAEARVVSEIRIQVVALIIAATLALIFTIFLFRYIKRKTPFVVTAIKASVKNGHAAKVSRIVVDETIRQETRDVIAGRLDLGKSILREQIANALDSGRADEAKALLSVLQRLEGDRTN